MLNYFETFWIHNNQGVESQPCEGQHSYCHQGNLCLGNNENSKCEKGKPNYSYQPFFP